MRVVTMILALISGEIYANTPWSQEEVEACLSQKAADVSEALADERFGEEDLALFAELLRVTQNPDCVVYINGRFGARCEPGSLTSTYPEMSCAEEGVKGLLQSGFPFIYLEKDSTGEWSEFGNVGVVRTGGNNNWN